MKLTARLFIGAVTAALLAGVSGLFFVIDQDVTAWLAALGAIARYVGLLILLGLLPIAIVVGAVWLAGKVLRGTGSGGH